MGSRWPAFGRSRPIDAQGRSSTHDGSVRVLVLWNRVGGLEPGEDESWARAEVARSRAMTALPSCVLQPVDHRGSIRHASPLGWCLEIRLAEGPSARSSSRDGRLPSSSTICGCSACTRECSRVELERADGARRHPLRRRARRRSPPSGCDRTKVALLGAVLRAAHADDRPGGGDRGDRLEHARPAGRDDAHRPGDRADRRLHVARDPGRAALARAPAARSSSRWPVTTAVLSAFLDNLTTVLLMVPITFLLADALDIDPIPLVIIEILVSNIGGTATLIGDPPNILIAGATDLSFMDFIVNLAPIAARRPSSSSPARLYLFYRRAAADRARGARARDGARRAPLDRGHGRAQAHRADPGRHDPAVLRPPGRCTSSRPRWR